MLFRSNTEYLVLIRQRKDTSVLNITTIVHRRTTISQQSKLLIGVVSLLESIVHSLPQILLVLLGAVYKLLMPQVE